MAEGTAKLAKALLDAQAEMPAVEPDAVNGHFKNRYVSLGHLITKVRPVLNKNGIAVTQFPSQDASGGPTLTTILMHESGESMEFAAPLFLPKNDPQGQGSAITYLRRYALASALGISDQEDDDGEAASGKPVEEPSVTAEKALEKVKESGLTWEHVTNWLHKNEVIGEDVTVNSDSTALAAIKRMDPTTRNRLLAAALAFKTEQQS